MTLVQLEYLISLDKHRHFAKAAEARFVTQPSLSMQIQKLEAELDTQIFLRNRLPITPTENGELIIMQARKILREADHMKAMIEENKSTDSGHLKIGIIPTLAPYLLPLFITDFIKKYPQVRLSISELTTEEITKRLIEKSLDAGIMATPLNEKGLHEQKLFSEPFIAYVNKAEKIYNKKYILPADIEVDRMWLAEEGHCIRNQVMNLCKLQKHSSWEKHLDYETGSLETLKRFVEQNEGITLLPELATIDLSPNKKKMLRYFQNPAPAREISMVTTLGSRKEKIVKILSEKILEHLPPSLKSAKKTMRLAINNEF